MLVVNIVKKIAILLTLATLVINTLTGCKNKLEYSSDKEGNITATGYIHYDELKKAKLVH